MLISKLRNCRNISTHFIHNSSSILNGADYFKITIQYYNMDTHNTR